MTYTNKNQTILLIIRVLFKRITNYCFIALIIYSVFVFQKCDYKQETLQPVTIDQLDKNESKEDSLNTTRANVLLCQKDSIIHTYNEYFHFPHLC